MCLSVLTCGGGHLHCTHRRAPGRTAAPNHKSVSQLACLSLSKPIRIRLPTNTTTVPGPCTLHFLLPTTPAGRPVCLWDEALVLSEAAEVLAWHEALPPGQLLEGKGQQLERRLLEYCCLGDYATAVAYLLSTPPESSVR